MAEAFPQKQNSYERYFLKVAIVVPNYKRTENLSYSESLLLQQVKKVFDCKSLFFASPQSLYNDHKECLPFQTVCFDNKFFRDKLTYSKLLCTKEFYESFTDFDYIQIIQTDCWVFEDRLDYFLSCGFDYIGAPWMKNGFEGKPQPEIWKVGNGGFSLRNVQTFLSILEAIKKGKKGRIPVFKDLRTGIYRKLKNNGIRNNLKHYIKNPPGEDIFWSIYVPEVFSESEFRIADHQTASSYSFEVFPQFLFEEITSGELPMGCHAWESNDPSFWSKHIGPFN